MFGIQILARQQAQREEELAQSQRHILALQVRFSGFIYLVTSQIVHGGFLCTYFIPGRT